MGQPCLGQPHTKLVVRQQVLVWLRDTVLHNDWHAAQHHVHAQPTAPAVSPWCQAKAAAAHKILEPRQIAALTDKYIRAQLAGLVQLPELLYRSNTYVAPGGQAGRYRGWVGACA